jgi:hypothetical protein
MAKKNINFNTYVERDLTKTTVDWGTVASKLTNDLGVIRKEREKRRSDIEAETIEVDRQLNELEDYTAPSMQNLALGMSGDSANFLRVQNDLFKRGQISQTEYAQARQRVLGDWKQFGSISKKWESDYAGWMARTTSGEEAAFGVKFNKQKAAFGNLENVTGYVNPQTGHLSLVLKNEDGTISDDPSKHVSMNVINNRMNGQVNNLTYDGNLDKQLAVPIDALGRLVKSKITAGGGVDSREGRMQVLQDDDMQAWLNTEASIFAGTDNEIFSILGDVSSKQYEPVFTEAEAKLSELNVLCEYDSNGNVIAVKDERAPNWEAQKTDAKDIIKAKLITMFDDVEAKKAGEQETAGQKTDREYKQSIIDRNLADDQLDLSSQQYDNVYINTDKKSILDGKNPRQFMKEDLGEWISTRLPFTDSDAELRRIFNKATNSLIDDRILLDLNNGKFGDKYKGLNVNYDDQGADRVTIQFGDKKKTYPPLIQDVRKIKINEEEIQTYFDAFNNGNFKASIGGDTPEKISKEEFENIIMGINNNENNYFFVTSEDGTVTAMPGLKNYDSDGSGMNTDAYDDTDVIYDYMVNNVFEPVVTELQGKQRSILVSKGLNLGDE